jgi:hypothetical protein
MKEVQLQKTIIDIAKRFHWMVAHFTPAQVRQGKWMTPVMADGAGFPDLILLRGPEVLVVELKGNAKYPDPNQRRWLDGFNEAGIEAVVWRPRDFDDDTVSGWLK